MDWEVNRRLGLERLKVRTFGWLVRSTSNAGGVSITSVADPEHRWDWEEGDIPEGEADTGAARKSAEGAFAQSIRHAGQQSANV